MLHPPAQLNEAKSPHKSTGFPAGPPPAPKPPLAKVDFLSPTSLSHFQVLDLAGPSTQDALAMPAFPLVEFQASISILIYPCNPRHLTI